MGVSDCVMIDSGDFKSMQNTNLVVDLVPEKCAGSALTVLLFSVVFIFFTSPDGCMGVFCIYFKWEMN